MLYEIIIQFKYPQICINFIFKQKEMQILRKLNQNNFNEMAKLIQNNSIPEQLMTGNIKDQVKRHKHSYTTPASIQLAKKHQKTTKFGYRYVQSQYCQCCNLRVIKQQIPLCESVEPSQKKKNQFVIDDVQYKLTTDVALFFTFIKSSIILMLINTLIHSIFNIITSIKFGRYCQSIQLECPKTIWNLTSLLNKYDRQDLIFIVDILNLVGIIISIIFFALNRRRQYKLSALIDKQTQTQADFTLLISNIPILQFPKKGQQGKNTQKLQFFYRKHLQEYFNTIIMNWIKNKNQWEIKKDNIGIQLLKLMNSNGGQLRSSQIVKTVSLCYNLSRLQVLQDIKSNLVSNFENQTDQSTSLLVNQNGQSLYSQRFASIPERINFLNDCEIILNGQFARDNSFLFSVTHFVGHAFVSFQYQHYKQYIQRLFIQNPSAFIYNGNKLIVEDASHPTDIYWQNIRISQKQRKRKIVSSYLILILVLVFTFVLLFGFELLKSHIIQKGYQDFIHIAKSFSITLGIALVILLINYGLNELIYTLTESQKRKTRTDFAFSFLFKAFLTKLINTVILYFLVALLFQTTPQQQFNGRIGVIFNLIIVSGLFHLLKSLIYPKDLFRRIKRWWTYKNYQDRVQNKFQVTLNKQFQLLQFQMAQKYSYYLVFIYTVFFYSYLVPIGVPAAIVILFLQYWVDKYTLFRKSSLKFHYGFNLSIYTSKLFETSILALGLGNFIFSIYVHRNPLNVLSVIGLGLSLGFVLCVWLIPKKIENIIFGSYEYNQKYTYDDCLHDAKFQTTYWNQNPATFLIEQYKVTGKKRAINPVLHRKSIQGQVFLSSLNI